VSAEANFPARFNPAGRGARSGVRGVDVTARLWEVSDLVALLKAEERGLERAA
jgi:hypothetical protein